MPVDKMARRAIHDDGLNPPDLLKNSRDGVLLRLRMDAEVTRIREKLRGIFFSVSDDSILPTAHSASFLGDPNTPPRTGSPTKTEKPPRARSR